MKVSCPHCGSEYEIDKSELFGYETCEVCGNGFVAGATASKKHGGTPDAAGAATNASQPAGQQRRRKLSLCKPQPDEAPWVNETEERLRSVINPRPPSGPAQAASPRLSSAEERLKMYDDMKRKMARGRLVRKFVEFTMLMVFLVVIVGLVFWWQDHKSKLAAEAERIEAERAANEIKLAEERDRLLREKREKDRLEREAARARENEEKERKRAEAERAKNELRANQDKYNMSWLALKDNAFDMFTKAATNGIDTAGGELCYLIPATGATVPLYLVDYAADGSRRVFRLQKSGAKDEMSADSFDDLIKDREYLVTRGSTVYFNSTRKPPETGLLSKDRECDPAEVFFGTLSQLMRELKPSYNELTFDIFITPKGSPEKIFVENVPFGCHWNRQKVREAIEKNMTKIFATSTTFVARRARFKRTAKLWNGSIIKHGIDGITYVPRTPPSDKGASIKQWQALYNRAMQEEADETAFHSRQVAEFERRRNSSMAEDEKKWYEDIEAVLRDGSISYKIRKAKIGRR